MRYIATNGPASAYQICKGNYTRVTAGYSTILQNIKQLLKEDIIELEGTKPSLKGGEQNIYRLSPVLGLSMSIACAADNENCFVLLDRLSKEKPTEGTEAYEATREILGKDKFRSLLRIAFLRLHNDTRKTRSSSGRIARFSIFFTEQLLDKEETSNKEVIELCKRSRFIAKHVEHVYVLCRTILRKSGRLSGIKLD